MQFYVSNSASRCWNRCLNTHIIKVITVQTLPIKSHSTTLFGTPDSSLSHLFVTDKKTWYSLQHKTSLHFHINNKKLWNELIRVSTLHYLTTSLIVNKGMRLHTILHRVVQPLSQYNLKISHHRHFKSSVKQNNNLNKTFRYVHARSLYQTSFL
jgi:hypothetical protein